MIEIEDKSGILIMRPHFKPEEIDDGCEVLVHDFLRGKYGFVKYPLSTEDLEVVADQYTDDFDTFADLSSYGNDVQGLTDFNPYGKPKISVSEKLAEYPRQNRRRTTIAHELGHAILHNSYWRLENLGPRTRQKQVLRQISFRSDLLVNDPTRWMEWQASRFSGALLMPRSAVFDVHARIRDLGYPDEPFPVDSSAGRGLADWTRKEFSVSKEAAFVRLKQLDLLTTETKEKIWK